LNIRSPLSSRKHTEASRFLPEAGQRLCESLYEGGKNMAYAARRHHRVAKKEAAQNPIYPKSVQNKNRRENRIIDSVILALFALNLALDIIAFFRSSKKTDD
jgi:hypothetical protein